MELEKSTTVIIIIVAIGLILGIGLFVLGQFQTTVFTDATTTSATQNITTLSTDTLSPIGVGITSSEVKANNNSWLEFDGVNDRVVATELPLNIGSNFSVSLWIYVINNSKSGQIISNYWNETNQFAFGVGNSGHDFIEGALYNGNSGGYYGQFRGESSFPEREWVHIVYSVNETQSNSTILKGNIYINNVKQSDAGGNIGGASNGLSIMARYAGNSHVSGAMDELRIYNETLTSAEITEIYNSGRQANSSLPSDRLVLWYSFDEASGTTVHDKSGNGNNGV